MPKTYSEKLRDPRWQKKRLEVMERDCFACQRCGNSANTLNVHHLIYDKGKAPWDYANDDLTTLCVECHVIAEDRETLKAFRSLLVAPGIGLETLRHLAATLADYAYNGVPDPCPTNLSDLLMSIRDYSNETGWCQMQTAHILSQMRRAGIYDQWVKSIRQP